VKKIIFWDIITFKYGLCYYYIMITKNLFNVFLALILIVLSLNLITAQTVIAGKIYNDNYSTTVADADVAVTCNSNTLTTLSLGDGTFAVSFDTGICNEPDAATAKASKEGLTGTSSGTVIKCDETFDCEGEYFALLNPNLKTVNPTPDPDNGGGGGGSWSGNSGFFMCGNQKCDTGETATTCPQDCKVTIVTNETTPEETSNQDPETLDEQISDSQIQENIFWKFNLRNMTGILAAIIILIIGLFITNLSVRKKNGYF
jgi:hypothetical protein